MSLVRVNYHPPPPVSSTGPLHSSWTAGSPPEPVTRKVKTKVATANYPEDETSDWLSTQHTAPGMCCRETIRVT